jgi:hypothetical protein
LGDIIMKKIKNIMLSLFLLFTLLVTMCAVPKPGPTVTLTLVNKEPSTTGYIYLKGLTNFNNYFLTARAYAIDVTAEKGMTGKLANPSPNNIKTDVTTYEVVEDVYEITIVACSFGTGGLLDLHGDTQVVIPKCKNSQYGQKNAVTIDYRSSCAKNPTLPACRKDSFIFTAKGGRGEPKNIKVIKPPTVR